MLRHVVLDRFRPIADISEVGIVPWLASDRTVVEGEKRHAYGPVMRLVGRTHWDGPVGRVIMLVLGIAASPVGLGSLQRPHCTQHEWLMEMLYNRLAVLNVASEVAAQRSMDQPV